jgi:DNA polymerase epsilon subunit 1
MLPHASRDPTVKPFSNPPRLIRYPALQWQLRAARRAVHRAAVVGGWLRERAMLTRYAHVPLSDLGADPSLAIADALYARCLRAAGNALWVRDPALPDPGEWGRQGRLSSSFLGVNSTEIQRLHTRASRN